MHPQFRYILLLLALTLFGFAMLGCSQEADNSLDQEQSPIRIFTIIFVAFVILAVFAGVIYCGVWIVREQQNQFDTSEQWWYNRFNESERHWDGRLKHILQQGKDNNQKLEELESKQVAINKNIQNTFSEIRARLDGFDLTLATLKIDVETGNTIDYQSEVKVIVQQAQARIEELARGYKNGEPIELDTIETPTPSQKILLTLNSMMRALHQWKTEAEKSENADQNLTETLTYRETDIRNKLKDIRENFSPALESIHVQTDVSTDAELDAVRNQCDVRVARFEGVLLGYEQGREVNTEEYDQFIQQFIKDRLVNGVARFIQFDQLPEQLDKFLQLVGYEVIPIEIGTTKVDSRIHEIQGAQRTSAEPGTIVEVILPGLMQKADGEIVQKPIVIRGE